MNRSRCWMRCASSPSATPPPAHPRRDSMPSSVRGWHSGWCRALRVASLMMLVSSCGTLPTRGLLRPPMPSAELLTPCQRPPPLADNSQRAMVVNHVEAMTLLDDCGRRQAELAQWALIVTGTADAWWTP